MVTLESDVDDKLLVAPNTDRNMLWVVEDK